MSGEWKRFMCIVALFTVFVTGCSSGSDTPGEQSGPEKSEEITDTRPVTLKIYSSIPLPEDDFNILFKEPMKKKYPHITLEVIAIGGGLKKLDELIAAKNVPDIILGTNLYKGSLQDLQLTYDITSLVKQFNVDLDRFEPFILDGFKNDKGELLALPYSINGSVMFYNKDLFDKFGVEYPEDGLNWDETISMARKLSRTAGGVQYRGLEPESIARLAAVRSLTSIDKNTGKAIVNNSEYKKVFELLHSIYSIPGNFPETINKGTLAVEKVFYQNRLAMFPSISNVMTRIEEATKNGLNWDLAQYPAFRDKPNTGMYLDAHGAYITKTSQHKEQAMLVLTTVSSDEVQTASTRKLLRITTLKNESIKKQVGADQPFMKGKHIEAIYKSKPAPAPAMSQYQNRGTGILRKKFVDYMNGKMDLNTALRQAEEEINQFMASVKGK